MIENYKDLFQKGLLTEDDINDLLEFGMITKSDREKILKEKSK